MESRGPVLEPENIEVYRVYAAQWRPGEASADMAFDYYLMAGEPLVKAKDGSWSTSVPYYWPGEGMQLSFFAYAPESVDGFVFVNPQDSPYDARFFYVPKANPRDHQEIIFSRLSSPVNHRDEPSRPVQLWFDHILTQISIVLVGDAKSVESVTLSGVAGCGNYHPHGSWWDLNGYDGVWGSGFTTAYTADIPADGVVGDDQKFMIIPQTTPADAKIEVRFRDGTYRAVPFGNVTLHSGAATNLRINLPQ